jgi:hypothetical protein
MSWVIALFAAALLLAALSSGIPSLALGILVLASLALLIRLSYFFAAGQGMVGLRHLFSPTAGLSFAQQHAPVGTSGAILLPFSTYKLLRRKLNTSLWLCVGLILITLAGLRVVPVPTVVIFAPALLLFMVISAYALMGLMNLLPSGQRLAALKSLFTADPRQTFAKYAPHTQGGAITVGYST